MNPRRETLTDPLPLSLNLNIAGRHIFVNALAFDDFSRNADNRFNAQRLEDGAAETAARSREIGRAHV